MNKTLFLVPVLAISHLAQAEAVQYQMSLGGSHSSYDTASSSAKSYAAGLSGTYFLSPVETNGIVQNELTFIRRANFITASVSHSEYEYDYSIPFGDAYVLSGESNYDYRSGFIGGQHFINENTFVGGSYTRAFQSDADGSATIHGGYYYDETSAVSASLTQRIGESDSTRFSIDNKSLLALNDTSSLTYGLGISAAVDNFEESVSVSFGTTYYFTDYTGLGVSGGYHIDTSEFGYSLSFSHFFNDSIGLDVSVSEADEGWDAYGVSIIGRF